LSSAILDFSSIYISVYAAEQRRTIGSIADEAILEYLARREAREYVREHKEER